jgi:hypothetical protein
MEIIKGSWVWICWWSCCCELLSCGEFDGVLGEECLEAVILYGFKDLMDFYWIFMIDCIDGIVFFWMN